MIAALGSTQQQPTGDRLLLTRSELLDCFAVLLGGRTAEELVFGEISTGTQSDLQRMQEILSAHPTILDELASLLSRKEKVMGEKLRRMIGKDLVQEPSAEPQAT